jgi:adenylate kinase family enzyme
VRIAIIGNSGSGKSTLARWLAEKTGAALLDLDAVAWVPGQIAVPRAPEDAENEVKAFCRGHNDWVVEGCYANLVHAALAFSPRLLFLNPGEEQCLANCRARPWEPHKYPSQNEQDTRLPFLLSWVRDYYCREGELSLAGHLSCFESYLGPKRELRTAPVLNPPSPDVLTWID